VLTRSLDVDLHAALPGRSCKIAVHRDFKRIGLGENHSTFYVSVGNLMDDFTPLCAEAALE
jgi:hypothetical protein